MPLHFRPQATGIHLARLATIAGLIEVTPALRSSGQVILLKIVRFQSSFKSGRISVYKLAYTWYCLSLVLRNAETTAATRLRREKGV